MLYCSIIPNWFIDESTKDLWAFIELQTKTNYFTKLEEFFELDENDGDQDGPTSLNLIRLLFVIDCYDLMFY